jgi:hypothetical protein
MSFLCTPAEATRIAYLLVNWGFDGVIMAPRAGEMCRLLLIANPGMIPTPSDPSQEAQDASLKDWPFLLQPLKFVQMEIGQEFLRSTLSEYFDLTAIHKHHCIERNPEYMAAHARRWKTLGDLEQPA